MEESIKMIRFMRDRITNLENKIIVLNSKCTPAPPIIGSNHLPTSPTPPPTVAALDFGGSGSALNQSETAKTFIKRRLSADQIIIAHLQQQHQQTKKFRANTTVDQYGVSSEIGVKNPVMHPSDEACRRPVLLHAATLSSLTDIRPPKSSQIRPPTLGNISTAAPNNQSTTEIQQSRNPLPPTEIHRNLTSPPNWPKSSTATISPNSSLPTESNHHHYYSCHNDSLLQHQQQRQHKPQFQSVSSYQTGQKNSASVSVQSSAKYAESIKFLFNMNYALNNYINFQNSLISKLNDNLRCSPPSQNNSLKIPPKTAAPKFGASDSVTEKTHADGVRLTERQFGNQNSLEAIKAENVNGDQPNSVGHMRPKSDQHEHFDLNGF